MNEGVQVMIDVMDGEAVVYPDGFSEDGVELSEGNSFSLFVPKTEGVPEGGSLEDFIKVKFDKDVGAPGVGSASKPFKPKSGVVRFTPGGMLLVRRYNALNPTVETFGREVVPESEMYVKADGSLTGDLWETMIVPPNKTVEVAMIEANKLTLAFYN